MIGGSVLDVLIPTCNRPCGLAVTLTALSAQSFRDFQIIVSDQSDGQSVFDEPEVAAVLRFLQASGRQVQTVRHLPRRGMAEQRAFLLSKVSAPYCLFLDDDVLLESDVIERLHRVITEQRCGFVGSALHGSQQWARHHLHSAANLFHVQTRLGLSRETTRLYRVAWIGGCVLFDTQKLRDVGGFDFWTALPGEHCGEDVLVQLRVMERFGGCGMIPSGAYHMELPTTISRREFDAPNVLSTAAPAATGMDQDRRQHRCSADES